MVTIKDVAKEAGVSHTAVSAVLNGKSQKARIGQATADRIFKAADKLGYKTNIAAKSLRVGKSFAIGILLPAPTDNFFAGIIGQLERMLAKTSYAGIFSFWSSAPEIKRAAQTILKRQIDGIITVEPDALPDELKIPVVSLLYGHSKGIYDFVELDRLAMFQDAISYLHGLGHRRIAKPDCFSKSKAVNSMFKQALDEHGLSGQWMSSSLPRLLSFDGSLNSACEQLLDQLLAETPAPTAIMMPNDLSAIALMAAAWRKGIRVPEDLSVIASDNISISESVIPPLTTFSFDGEKSMAEHLVDTLMNRLEKPDIARQRVAIKPTLVVRQSCAKIG